MFPAADRTSYFCSWVGIMFCSRYFCVSVWNGQLFSRSLLITIIIGLQLLFSCQYFMFKSIQIHPQHFLRMQFTCPIVIKHIVYTGSHGDGNGIVIGLSVGLSVVSILFLIVCVIACRRRQLKRRALLIVHTEQTVISTPVISLFDCIHWSRSATKYLNNWLMPGPHTWFFNHATKYFKNWLSLDLIGTFLNRVTKTVCI